MAKSRNSLLCLTLLGALVGCASEPLKVVTVNSSPNITTPPRPRAVEIQPLTIQVVTGTNLSQLTGKISADPKSVFLILTASDYTNLISNIGELKRYIEQQTSVIEYYESTIATIEKPPVQP